MKTVRVLFATLCIGIMVISCNSKLDESFAPDGDKAKISNEVLSKLKAQGYSTVGVQKFRDGYLVEGDIFLHDSIINQVKSQAGGKIGQYRVNNLLNLPRTITVSILGFSQVYIDATDAAIARYNAQNLRINFQRVSFGSDITISSFDEGPRPDGTIVLGASGPPSNGNPNPSITLNTNPSAYGSNPDQNWITTVIAHEIGHSIGFRHTDYFNRNYSCPWSSNSDEGVGVFGAVHIPGTPSTEDANSWMLACIGTGVNRPFTSNDVTALQYLFGSNCGGLTNVQTIIQDRSVWFTWNCSDNPSWASISWQERDSNSNPVSSGTTQTDCTGGGPGTSTPQITAQHGNSVTAIITPKCFSGADGPATTLTFTIP